MSQNSPTRSLFKKDSGLYFFVIGFLLLCIWQCAKESTPVTNIEKLAGNYQTRESCRPVSSSNGTSVGNVSFVVSISITSVANATIKIGNFYNLGTSKAIDANLSGNTIIIPNQTYSNAIIYGNGQIDGNNIYITYVYDDGNSLDSCNASLTKL